MFEVRDRSGNIIYRNESFLACRVRAQKCAGEHEKHFYVYEVKQVYTTEIFGEGDNV
jgi:hypothetical protein